MADCNKVLYLKGLCRMHHARWKRHGDPNIVLVEHRMTGKCSAPECGEDAAHNFKGVKYCGKHYHRTRKHGDPSITLKGPVGQGSIDGAGYKVICVNGRRIREHRYVVEKYLGRELLKTEVVHHKDGNKLNNSIDNLEVIDRALHPKEHATFRNDTHKECSLCRQVLPRDSFYRNSLSSPSNKRDTHGSQCKKCSNEEMIKRYKAKRSSVANPRSV